MTSDFERKADELSERVWRAISKDGESDPRPRVAEAIAEVGLANAVRTYTLWVMSTVGVANVMTPIENGMNVDNGQAAGFTNAVSICSGHRVSVGLDALSRAYGLVGKGALEEIGAEFTRIWSTDEAEAADMLAMAALVLRRISQDHPANKARMVNRAADLRVTLVDVRTQIKETDWCSHCLPLAVKVAEIADDRKPVEHNMPTAADDTSWLDGIDLEGEANGKE